MIQTFLGFDVGTKRTGIALGNSLTLCASGIAAVTHHKNGATNWMAIGAIVTNYKVDKFVVGLPLRDGKEQTMSLFARAFGRKLSARFGVEVAFVDEYLSSREARQQLAYRFDHPNAKRTDVDKRAAQLILQTWINEQTFNQ